MASIVPVERGEARKWLEKMAEAVPGEKSILFSVGIEADDELKGALVVGRPKGACKDKKRTAEIIAISFTYRLKDSRREALKLLLWAAWRAAAAMGYNRLILPQTDRISDSALLAAQWIKVEKKGKVHYERVRDWTDAG